MKNKAFTLIELLAVIIILGMLMLIAIPSVTNYINESRKNSYVTTIKELIKGTTTKVNSGDIEVNDTDKTYYIPCSCIDTENGKQSSPYGEFDPAYIVATFDGENYNYYFTGKDVQNIGIPKLLKSDLIANDSIITNISSIDTTIGIRGTSEVVVYNSDCSRIESTNPASTTTSGKTKKVCTNKTTNKIYWALQDNDQDGYTEKLVLSDHEVEGELSGYERGNKGGSSYPSWYLSSQWGTGKQVSYVTEVIVEGNIAPTVTSYWFYNIGSYVSSFSLDLDGLEMCNVTNTSHMFHDAAPSATTWTISDISDWDVSNVKDFSYMFSHCARRAETIKMNLDDWDTSSATNMQAMFFDLGYFSASFSIGTLKNWNTSKVTNMQAMFPNAGQNSTTFRLDLSDWDVSNVINMEGFLNGAGEYSTTYSIGDLSNWNTSKVQDMSGMFGSTGRNSSIFIQDLSKWDTSNVINMWAMFNGTGSCSTTWSIGDISNWDTSKVNNMNSLFQNSGNNAENWNVGNIGKWNTSNVTNMAYMFAYAAINSTNLSIDLSSWNTSNVVNMESLFNGFGKFSKNVSINLSGFDTSKVKYMCQILREIGCNADSIYINIDTFNTSSVTTKIDLSYMFYRTGFNCSNWQVIIPKTNGNGINNTTTVIYGSDSTIYYADLQTGKHYTLATV